MTRNDSNGDRALLVETRQQEQARDLLEEAGSNFTAISVVGPRDEYIAVPATLTAVIRDVVAAMASGHRISVSTLPEELTTTVAAEQLGVSRPTLMKMIARDEIAAHKVGSHHRLRTEDVVAYKKQRLERQRQALIELRNIDAALDDY